MKRYLTFAVMAIAMLLSVASCKKESVNEPELVAGPGEFIATIASNSIQNAPEFGGGKNSTKATFNGKVVVWQQNDTICINGERFNCTEATKSAAIFTVNTSGRYVSSPFSAYYGCKVTSSTSVAIPDTMTYSSTNLANNLPMYAYSTSTSLTFHNLCAALKVTNIPSNATRITVSAKGTILNGTFTVSGNTTDSPYAVTGTADSNTTTTTVTGISGASEVYIPIPQGEYTNFTVTVYDNSNTSLFTHTLAKISFMANKIYNAPCQDNLVKFTALDNNCTISLGCHESQKTASSTSSTTLTNQLSLDWIKYNSSNVQQGSGTLTIQPDGTVGGTQIPALAVGDYVTFRATSGITTNKFMASDYSGYRFTTTGRVNISGNILYLIDHNGSSAAAGVATGGESAVGGAFEFTQVVDASGLIIPPVASENFCREMFLSCTNLITPPELPELSELPGKWACRMFQGCTALESAPVLKSPKLLGVHNYTGIFTNCEKIHTVKILATSITNSNALGQIQVYTSWLQGAGTDGGTSTNTVIVSNSITNLTDGAGKIIADATPTTWQIETESGTILRARQSN